MYISLLLSLLIATQPDASWPEPRGNAQLHAEQSVAGQMGAEAKEVARLDLGRGQATLTPVTLGDGRVLGVAVFGGATYAYTPEGTEAWFTHPAGLNFTTLHTAADLDGDGRVDLLLTAGRPAEPYGAAVLLDAETGALRWHYNVEPMSYSWTMHVDGFLPGAIGRQIVVMMHGYPPDLKNGYIALFEFTAPGEQPRQRWHYDFDAYTCFPSLLRSDLDGDGTKEVVVETHSRMWFLDTATGGVKHFASWDVSPANVRSYGLVKFADLNRDGRDDFLCIANFAQHHEVLLNRDGRMELAWHQGWGESVTTGKVATRYPPVPDVDLDGDGRVELVLSMFNGEDKAEWITRVYDAVSGELKQRVPGMIAMTCIDLDGDGGAEVLMNACADPSGTSYTGASLWKVRGGVLEEVWKSPEATALHEKEAIVQVGTDKFTLTHSPDAGFHLTPREVPAAPVAPVFANVPATVGNAMPTLLAAPLNDNPGCELLVYAEPKATLYTLRGGALERIGEYLSSSLPAIGDFDGDAHLDLVLTTVSSEATPQLRCITPGLEDAERWNVNLPAPGRTGLPAPRKAYLRTARLRGGDTPDLYAWFGVPVARSVGIDGRSGALLWEKGEVPGMERYQGASVNHAAVWDYNADEKEELLYTNPDYYCVADGPTGNLLLGPSFPPDIFKQPSQGLYTFPAVLPREQQQPLVCLAGGHYFLAAMTVAAEPLWYHLPAPGDNRCATEAFTRDSAGNWHIGIGRQNGRFACINAESGSTVWEVELGASASDALAWDSDGDGQQEFIVGDSHGKLHRLTVSGDGAPNHRVQSLGRAPLGTPMAADLDGDGNSELALTTGDGWVVILR